MFHVGHYTNSERERLGQQSGGYSCYSWGLGSLVMEAREGRERGKREDVDLEKNDKNSAPHNSSCQVKPTTQKFNLFRGTRFFRALAYSVL